MKTRKGEVITRREIDVMGEEELLDLVRRHARLLGEQFPKQADRFYCPDILDESHLLRKLYRLDRERFVELVREQNKREYIAGGHWAAILISQGETLPEEVLRRQEQVMSKADAHCKLVLERLWNPGWPQRDFEEELKKVGLLISEAHPDWDSPKLAKLQRLALTRAMVCHYQWRAGELRSALAAAPQTGDFHRPGVGSLPGGQVGEGLPPGRDWNGLGGGRSAVSFAGRCPSGSCCSGGDDKRTTGPLEKAAQRDGGQVPHPPADYPTPAPRVGRV